MEILRFTTKARKWTEALPLGNGKTGIMLYGNTPKDNIFVNDTSLWSGYPKDRNNPDSKVFLDKVRQLIFDKKYFAAEKLCMEKMRGDYSEAFLPLGKIVINYNGLSNEIVTRQLDLSSAIFTGKGKEYLIECFANHPKKVVCYKFAGIDKINAEIKLTSKIKNRVEVADGISLVGQAPDYVAPNYDKSNMHPVIYKEKKGMAFALRVEAVCNGRLEYTSRSIKIHNASEFTLFFTTATGFESFDRMPSVDIERAEAECRNVLTAAGKDYEELKTEHIKDYRAIYEKNSFSLYSDANAAVSSLLDTARKGAADNGLIELMYNYGKYLLIASSRKGSQAANLQGIWNKDLRPAWSSNYTVNINTQMNYWHLTKSNLMECAEPFINLVYEVMLNGKATAAVNYGCRGFCCNHNVDIWRKTSPVKGTVNYMYAPLCGAWLANEAFGHFKNGRLTDYADKVKEITVEAVKFVNDYLIEYDGRYVICPSTSPEAMFFTGGKRSGISMATAFDMSVVKQLFVNYLSLEIDGDLTDEIKNKLDKLYPLKSGNSGVREFFDDAEITEKGHRHFSPLYAAYPGNTVKYYKDKEQIEWIKKLFGIRIAGSKNHIGWSACWAICLAAGLHDSKQAETIINSFFKNSVFNNLFDAHYPDIFQIDGNFGFVAAINETLVYYENGIAELLPAILKGWERGSVNGYVIDGKVICFSWENGKVVSIESDSPIKVLNKNLAALVQKSANVQIVENME